MKRIIQHVETTLPFLVIAILVIWYLVATQEERNFIKKVQQEIQNGVKELDLARLKDGSWELVCNINGYDGSLFIKKYNKTYPSAGDLQDGAWGLTFINPDGSYESIGGSRGDGFNFDFGCMENSNSKLKQKINNEKMWVPKSRKSS